MAQAQAIFSRNMDKYGFSFTPLGIFRAAFDAAGHKKPNWKLAMQLHQPSPSEHPDLFQPPRFADMSAAAKFTLKRSASHLALFALLFVFMAVALFTLSASAQTTYTLTGNICASANCQCDSLGNCTQTFLAGTLVTLTPKASPGYEFIGWIGEGLSGAKPASLVMSQDRRVYARFESILYRNLYVIGYGTGSGKVISNPAGINGINTVKQYPDDSKVTLAAQPDPDTVFAGWKLSSGTCSGTGDCVVTMTKSKIVTAVFKKK